MALTIFVGFDLPLESLGTSGAELPYRDYAFLGLGLMIFLINLRRSVRRWMGLRIVNQVHKFKWNEPVSKERKQRVQVYTLLEVFVFISISYSCYHLTPEAWPPVLAFLLAACDGLFFTVIGSFRNRFRVGITAKAIVSGDRDVALVYFSGLRKISIHQDTIYFDYIKNLQLSIPLDCISIADRNTFFKALENQLDTNRVFITQQR